VPQAIRGNDPQGHTPGHKQQFKKALSTFAEGAFFISGAGEEMAFEILLVCHTVKSRRSLDDHRL